MGWGFGTLVIDGAAGPTGWYPSSYVGPLDRWHFDGIKDLYASLVLFQHDQRSDLAPQARRGDRARDGTCVVCYREYFGRGRCINEPRCPRGRYRRRDGEDTLMAARSEWARIVKARNMWSRLRVWFWTGVAYNVFKSCLRTTVANNACQRRLCQSCVAPRGGWDRGRRARMAPQVSAAVEYHGALECRGALTPQAVRRVFPVGGIRKLKKRQHQQQ